MKGVTVDDKKVTRVFNMLIAKVIDKVPCDYLMCQVTATSNGKDSNIISDVKVNPPKQYTKATLEKVAGLNCSNGGHIEENINFGLKDGKLDGAGISLERLASMAALNSDGNKQYLTSKGGMVIISEIWLGNDKELLRLIGYRVVNVKGAATLKLKDALTYGRKMTEKGEVPFQNAQFVSGGNVKSDFIRSYENHRFMIEVVKSEQKKVERSTFDVSKTEDTKKLESKFKKEAGKYDLDQRRILELAMKDGVLSNTLMNPELNKYQMSTLRSLSKEGVDISEIGNPEFTSQVMMLLGLDMKNGYDISQYNSPEYTFEQISELSLANELGVDLKEMLNPSLTSIEMQRLREKKEKGLWKTTDKWRSEKEYKDDMNVRKDEERTLNIIYQENGVYGAGYYIFITRKDGKAKEVGFKKSIDEARTFARCQCNINRISKIVEKLK